MPGKLAPGTYQVYTVDILLSQVSGIRYEHVLLQCTRASIPAVVLPGNPRRWTKERGPATNGDGALTPVRVAIARKLQWRTRRWRLGLRGVNGVDIGLDPINSDHY